MPESDYPGPERRKFRRIDLKFPVHIETVARTRAESMVAFDGLTVNLSFGGALVGVAAASGLQGAMPVEIAFARTDAEVRPPALSGVVWRLDRDRDDGLLAIEFDAPLRSYRGSVELQDRLAWLENMGGAEFRDNIIDSFLKTVPSSIQIAVESGESGDLFTVSQAARSLKSSAGNIGAVSLYEVARRAEQAALEGDAAAASRSVASLDSYFEDVKKQLAEIH